MREKVESLLTSLLEELGDNPEDIEEVIVQLSVTHGAGGGCPACLMQAVVDGVHGAAPPEEGEKTH